MFLCVSALLDLICFFGTSSDVKPVPLETTRSVETFLHHFRLHSLPQDLVVDPEPEPKNL